MEKDFKYRECKKTQNFEKEKPKEPRFFKTPGFYQGFFKLQVFFKG